MKYQRLQQALSQLMVFFCKGIVRYNHLNGQALEHLGLAPKIKILMFDCGGKVDTLSFNRRKNLKRL